MKLPKPPKPPKPPALPEIPSERPPEPPEPPLSASARLRRRAEYVVKAQAQSAFAPKLVHELQVHQIELEMQNDELQKAHAETEAALARYTDLYDFAPAGYFTLAPAGEIVQTNLSGARLLGLERARLTGKRLGAFVTPADLPVFNGFLAQVFASGIDQTCEVDLASQGLPQRSVRIDAAPSTDGRDCRCVVVNITASKLAQLQLKETEERYRLLVENAPEGIFLHFAGVIEFANPAIARMLLAPHPDALIGCAILDLTHPDDVAATTQRLREISTGATRPAFVDCRLRRFDGGWVEVEIASTSFMQSGRLAVQTLVVDVSTRRATEGELRRSHQTFYTMFRLNSMPGTYTRLADDVILEVNDAWLRLFGYSREEVVGRSVFDLGLWPDPGTRTPLAVAIARDGAVTLVPVQLRRRDGELLDILFSAQAFKQDDGTACMVTALLDVTETRRAEERLRQSEARWRFALDGAGDGVWDMDVPTSTVWSSRRYGDMLGYAEDEFATGPGEWASHVHPQDLPCLMADLQSHLDGQTAAFANEHRVRCKDGSYKWILGRGLLITRDAAGQPQRIVGTNTDLTLRKQNEELLRVSADRTRRILRAAAVGLWEWNLLTDAVYFSPEWKKQLGYADDEIANRFDEWQKRVHPDDLARVLAAIQDFRDGRLPRYGEEMRMLHHDGSWRWTYGEADLERNDKGEPVLMMGSQIDITERKRMALALADSELFAHATIDAVSVHLCVLDRAGQIVMVNRAWRDFSNRNPVEPASPNDGIGTNYLEICGSANGPKADEAAPMMEGIRSVMQGRCDEFTLEYPCHSATEQRWFVARVTRFHGDSGNIVVAHENITAAKLADRARSEIEAQLRESQKMEAVGTLAGGIAHDFNNILAAILGNIALAEKDLSLGEMGEAQLSLAEINKAAVRAKSLVMQILTFSRKQQQELTLQPLCPLVEEAVRLLRATLPANVEIVTALADAPLQVRADSTQIVQVLLNLCTNAANAIEGNAGQILIELAEVHAGAGDALQINGLEAGGYARIRVSDTGCGMDADTQAHIFEPFFTTKGVGVGTGLGLSVVHGIVKTHQGVITVESAAGKGSRFDIYLPIAAAASEAVPIAAAPMVAAAMAAAPMEAAAPPAKVPASQQAQGQRVVYVDDDEAMVFLVTRMLQRLNYRVRGFAHGAAALEAVRANPDDVDTVVTDFNMPGLSGIALAEELRRIRPGLPVVITSGYVTDELIALARAAGAREVVYKPNTVDQLCVTICRVLETPGA